MGWLHILKGSLEYIYKHNISLDIVMGFVVERDVNCLHQLPSVPIIFALLESFFSS